MIKVLSAYECSVGLSQKRDSDDRKKGFPRELSDELTYMQIFYKIIKINPNYVFTSNSNGRQIDKYIFNNDNQIFTF